MTVRTDGAIKDVLWPNPAIRAERKIKIHCFFKHNYQFMTQEFTQSFNARDWAKAFIETAKQKPDIAMDEETMTGWFANAIMRGYDEGRRSDIEEPLNPVAHHGPYKP